MRMHQLEEQIMTNHIIEQLHQLEEYDTEGKTLRELKHRLATLRAMEVDVESPEMKWF